MSTWFPDEIDEWFGGDMDEAREHMAHEREQRLVEIDRELAEAHQELDGGGGNCRTAVLERIAELSAERLGFAGKRMKPDTEDDEEPDQEPSADQEKAWDEQYDGTSLGS